ARRLPAPILSGRRASFLGLCSGRSSDRLSWMLFFSASSALLCDLCVNLLSSYFPFSILPLPPVTIPAPPSATHTPLPPSSTPHQYSARSSPPPHAAQTPLHASAPPAVASLRRPASSSRRPAIAPQAPPVPQSPWRLSPSCSAAS